MVTFTMTCLAVISQECPQSHSHVVGLDVLFLIITAMYNHGQCPSYFCLFYIFMISGRSVQEEWNAKGWKDFSSLSLPQSVTLFPRIAYLDCFSVAQEKKKMSPLKETVSKCRYRIRVSSCIKWQMSMQSFDDCNGD